MSVSVGGFEHTVLVGTDVTSNHVELKSSKV